MTVGQRAWAHVGGAYPVAVGNRRQALHRRAEQARERLRLGLEQLGGLRRDVRVLPIGIVPLRGFRTVAARTMSR